MESSVHSQGVVIKDPPLPPIIQNRSKEVVDLGSVLSSSCRVWECKVSEFDVPQVLRESNDESLHIVN